MRYKIKAAVTGAVSLLPKSVGEAAWLRARAPAQRIDHRRKCRSTLELMGIVQSRTGLEWTGLEGARVMQFGNGFGLTAAVVPWLLRAERTVVVDKRRCFDPRFARSWGRWLDANREWLQEHLPGADAESARRISRLLKANSAADPLEALFEACSIDYRAPADAGDLDPGQEAGFDLHMSTAVLEHMPLHAIRKVLETGWRMLEPGGLAVHLIDHSDHYAYSDPRISAVNFLRFSDSQWRRYNNPIMYTNRLRASEFPTIFSAAGFEVLETRPVVDEAILRSIESGEFEPAGRFREMAARDLATTSSTVIARRPA